MFFHGFHDCIGEFHDYICLLEISGFKAKNDFSTARHWHRKVVERLYRPFRKGAMRAESKEGRKRGGVDLRAL